MPNTTDKIRKYLVDNSSWGEQELSDTESLIDHDIIDSLLMLGLIGFLETEFKIRISDNDVLPKNFETILRIAELVREKSA